MLSFGAILERLGGSLGEAPALIHGDMVVSWADYARRTAALAAAFVAAGAGPGDKVAHLMRNSPAYLETTGAAFRARMVHVNVNYRYTAEELCYILDNSDAAVVVFDAEFADAMDSIRARLPLVKLWLQVGGTPTGWAQSYDAVADSGATLPPQAHRFGDQLFIYTGGTTGYPKGVMWEHGALWTLLGGGAPLPGMPPAESLDAHVATTLALPQRRKLLAMPPLMHGSAFLLSIYVLACGGAVITSPAKSFEAADALALAARHNPDTAVIVGDAFARPILRALDAGEGSLGAMMMMISSGTMWSPEVKAGLIRHNPGLMCLDAFGSSEGLGYGASISTAAAPDAPTRFMHDPNTLVLDEDNRPIEPGSGRSGRVARTGLIPLGYYKDPAKSAATFVEIDGRRFTIPGDWATVDPDGAIILLGRGSQCINSGGEKIFPEEVEEALKTHAAVEDALVFGVADEKWGQAVTAVVELTAPAEEAALIAHVKTALAAYKAPKRVHVVAKVPRAPNGKADYAAARALAA
ncbi:AMP-binding protein [Sandaracinobacteroides saxicola]|uniref:AMP-binding protein n=1 Tax=Sandaracinobacteroides saxicola TaxID=2759707 RepID=A0A7G5IKX9_9SPHN|nr:AMP-binding protein [Sandaracinobacteroides saxicola]QMW24021.1 AMP-binding protein [Sandaracinobacteroides saxicola]